MDEVTGEKKRKKGLKEKIKEKISGDHKENSEQKVEMENCSTGHVAGNANYAAATQEDQEKKGIMDKIKDKLPGHHNKTDQEFHPTTHATADEQVHGGDQTKEKKGLLDKIKEKLPGHGHKNTEDHEEKHKSN